MTRGGKALTPEKHDPGAINAPVGGTKAGTQHIKRHGPKRHIVPRRVSARQIYRALVSVRIDGCSPSGLQADVRINGVRMGRHRRALPPKPSHDPARTSVMSLYHPHRLLRHILEGRGPPLPTTTRE